MNIPVDTLNEIKRVYPKVLAVVIISDNEDNTGLEVSLAGTGRASTLELVEDLLRFVVLEPK